MSRARRAALGGAVSVLQMLVQLALQALLYPLLLRAAGAPTMGAWSMLQQLLGYFALSDLGFGTALGRWLARASGEGIGSPAFQSLLRGGRALQLASGVVYAGLCLALVPLLGWERLQLPEASRADAARGLVLLAAWSLLRAPAALSLTALQATQRMAQVNALNLVSSALRLGLSVLFTLWGKGIVGLVAASIAGEAASIAGASLLLSGLGRAAGRWLEWPSRAVLRELASFGVQSFTSSLAVKAIYASDTLMVGALYGAAAAGAYYATQVPGLFCAAAIWSLQANLSPGLSELAARGDEMRLRAVFLDLLQLTSSLAAPLAVGIALFTPQVVALWMGPAQYAGPLLTYALAPFAGITLLTYLCSQMFHALGELRTFTLLVSVEGLINLGLSFLLGKRCGPGGVMLASLIATVPTIALCLRRLAVERFAVEAGEVWRFAVRPALATAAAALTGGLLGRAIMPGRPWLSLGLFAALGGPVLVVSNGVILRQRFPALARVLP